MARSSLIFNRFSDSSSDRVLKRFPSKSVVRLRSIQLMIFIFRLDGLVLRSTVVVRFVRLDCASTCFASAMVSFACCASASFTLIVLRLVVVYFIRLDCASACCASAMVLFACCASFNRTFIVHTQYKHCSCGE